MIICGHEAAAVAPFYKVCIAGPAIRFLEPEFLPTPNKVIHKKGDRARLFCSVVNLGELTVTWRKTTESTPITIGTMTWINDPRIQVDHMTNTNQWDLVINGVVPPDAGQYECQVSTSQKLLRHRVTLDISDMSSGQIKRNQDIVITGSQFLRRGADINLMCNASVPEQAKQTLVWLKEYQEVTADSQRVFVSSRRSPDRNQLSSNLYIRNARTDDSGIYTCKSRDDKLVTSAQVNVMTGGSSNNVKRAGATASPSESSAVLSVRSAISHVPFIIATILIHRLFS
ncbi:fibroblast growth factor receptor 4 [Plakobranchus ocellatus]|uniref:Fibroblast growth factor receptor 4 n=1 Tax=Plakobranchus ocellatus TaxID=259542 RepID=A0AAV4CQD7_9GAST|nr:fibroblast growth factor receptor 4 [Plakobranchus ocellatus]